jgi:hypothetical protein
VSPETRRYTSIFDDATAAASAVDTPHGVQHGRRRIPQGNEPVAENHSDHVDNLRALGGKIIRDLNENPFTSLREDSLHWEEVSAWLLAVKPIASPAVPSPARARSEAGLDPH